MFPLQSNRTDADLVHGCLSGDDRCWEVLVRRYRSLVWSVARSRGLHGDDAAEVFQATWVQVHASLPSLRSVDRLAGWIAAVARSRCSRWFRRRGRERDREEALRDEAHAVGENADDAERFQEVREGLEALSRRCRDLLRDLYWERHSYDEVAAKTGVPRGSIGPTRARCLKKLREWMEEDR